MHSPAQLPLKPNQKAGAGAVWSHTLQRVPSVPRPPPAPCHLPGGCERCRAQGQPQVSSGAGLCHTWKCVPTAQHKPRLLTK